MAPAVDPRGPARRSRLPPPAALRTGRAAVASPRLRRRPCVRFGRRLRLPGETPPGTGSRGHDLASFKFLKLGRPAGANGATRRRIRLQGWDARETNTGSDFRRPAGVSDVAESSCGKRSTGMLVPGVRTPQYMG